MVYGIRLYVVLQQKADEQGLYEGPVLSDLRGRSARRIFTIEGLCRNSVSSGEVWWDYHEKPFNYQGLICLESTIAWGFYAVIIIGFLHGAVMKYAGWYTYGRGRLVLRVVLLVVLIDFFWHLLAALHVDVAEKRDRLMERCRGFLNRRY